MPNNLLVRPADGNEVSGAYCVAIEERHRPTILCLSRQAVPNLPGTSLDGVLKGGYVAADVANPDVILVGTGTELSLCYAAAKLLEGVRVRIVLRPEP